MRALKLTFALACVAVVIQYVPAYYNSSEFDEFVRQETRHSRVKDNFKQHLMSKAGQYSLSVREENINITTQDSVFRVAVDYQVPVDLFFFEHELKFHTVASRPAFASR